MIVRRYAALARRWHVLSPEAWTRLDLVSRRAAIDEAARHTTDARALAAIGGVRVLIDRAIDDERVTPESWATAREVASEAAEAACAASNAASNAATGDAWAASDAESWAAWAACAACEAACWAAVLAATGGVRAAWETAWWAARVGGASEAAWDRMAAAILDAIELELELEPRLREAGRP